MESLLRRSVALLLLGAVCSVPHVAAKVSAQGQNAVPLSPVRVVSSSVGSVAAGCSLCRDSGNCSVATNDSASGVFCGDLHAEANTQPCCCPYYTECRVTSKSLTCECGGAWSAQLEAQRHERLSATEAANETEVHQVQDSFAASEAHLKDSQMSVTTEILIHLSAYLALFVFAAYVDHWVECFSDFRRNRMVAYGEAVDMKMLRFRQRFGKRRRDSEVDTDADDNLPLLVLQSPAPTSSPAFTFANVPEAEVADIPVADEQKEPLPEEVVVVTVPVDAVQEVSTSLPESLAELQEISLE
ncbi:hypothetical protein PRIC1_013698 [Phytophthora ramorum]